MGKSEWRNLLAETYYPEAHSKGQPPLVKVQATVVIHDSMQLLRSMQGKNLKTCVDLVQAFRAAALESLKLGSKVHTFVYSFDKYPFVPVSKGVEQRARDKRPSAAAAGADDEDTSAQRGPRFPGALELAIGNKLDDEWLDHLSDRNWHTPRYIRFIVTQLLTGPPNVRLHVRPGCRVIFDGHYIEDLGAAPWACLPSRVQAFPFLLQRIPIEINGDETLPILREDLENTIGEGDFTIAFLLAKLAPDEPAIVYSVDSDLVWVVIRFFEKFPAHPGIAMFFWPHLSYVVSGTYPDGRAKPTGAPPWQRWWDMKLLRNLIRDDPRLRAAKNPLRVLETVCIASGGDYVPYLEIPPPHWVNALYRTPEKFADLCRSNNTISFKPYVSLVRAALTTAKRATVPEMTVMRNNFDCTVHYLDMMDQVARPEGVLYEQNPLFFGYSRIDKTKPLTRENIQHKKNDPTSDAARLLPEHDRTHYGLWPDYPPRTSPLPPSRARTAPQADGMTGMESSDESESLGEVDSISDSDSDSDTVIADAVFVLDGDSGDDDIDTDTTSDSSDEVAETLHTAFGPVRRLVAGGAGTTRTRTRIGTPAPPRDRTLIVSITHGTRRFGTRLQLPRNWPGDEDARKVVVETVQRKLKRDLGDLAHEVGEEEEQQRRPQKQARKA